MSHTYYNSLDTAYKTPFGAVPAGQTVTFRLTVPGIPGLCGPPPGAVPGTARLAVHYRMEFDGPDTPAEPLYLHHRPARTPGLYFYYFDLYTDFRRIYRDASGEGVLSLDRRRRLAADRLRAGFQDTADCDRAA